MIKFGRRMICNSRCGGVHALLQQLRRDQSSGCGQRNFASKRRQGRRVPPCLPMLDRQDLMMRLVEHWASRCLPGIAGCRLAQQCVAQRLKACHLIASTDRSQD